MTGGSTGGSAATPLPDLTRDGRAIRATKRPIPVPVTFAAVEGVVETLEGPVAHRAGDAVLTGVRGERWPVGREAFLAAYDPLPPTAPGEDGLYVKRRQESLALRLEEPVTVPVGWRSDPLLGQPGDWLLRYGDGSYGVVRDEVFRETYEILP